MALAACRRDTDCRSAYLICVPPDYVTIEVCRDPDSGADASAADYACPVFPELFTGPICPHNVNVTSTVCEVRYQRPCAVDADCGPVGFSCMSGRCEQKPFVRCSSAADCPMEWDCYVPCGCPGIRDTKSCQPPFVDYHCPECSVASDGGD
jgi:hypothetical protein